jgi:hypothetical protein
MHKLALVVAFTAGLLVSGGARLIAVGASSTGADAETADAALSAETAELPPEEETVELVTFTCGCFVLPNHDWRLSVADWQFGVIDYGYGSFVVWNDQHFGPIPCSAPKLAMGGGLALIVVVLGAATLRTRDGGRGGAS